MTCNHTYILIHYTNNITPELLDKRDKGEIVIGLLSDRHKPELYCTTCYEVYPSVDCPQDEEVIYNF